jgi:5'(3')-deoxyribonucleotidase
VCTQFLKRLLDTYNTRYNKNIKINNITDYYMEQFIGKEGTNIFAEKGFFVDLEMYPGANKLAKYLNDNFDLTICSHAPTLDGVIEKYHWIYKYFPFIHHNQININYEKWRMSADCMIDDNPSYLQQFAWSHQGFTICVDKPYNKNILSDYRIRNNDCEKIIETMEEIKNMGRLLFD